MKIPFRQILSVAGQIAPIVLTVLGHGALAPYVSTGVAIASQHPTATGPEKLDLATQSALNALAAANAEAAAQGHPPIFDVSVAASLIRNASAVVWDASKVVVKTAPVVAGEQPEG